MQDQGSKIPCVKFGAMKIIPSDRLHQDFLKQPPVVLVEPPWWQIGTNRTTGGSKTVMANSVVQLDHLAVQKNHHQGGRIAPQVSFGR